MRAFHCPDCASALREDFMKRSVKAIVERDGLSAGEKIAAYWKVEGDERQYGDVYRVLGVTHPVGILPGYACYLVCPIGRRWRRWTKR